MYTPIFRVQLVREGQWKVERPVIRMPEDAAAVLQAFLKEYDREVCVLMGLTTKNRLIGLHIVSIGCLDASIVRPREVFQAALLMNAACILVGHNHPSAEPEPSEEDCQVTEKLVQAGAILGVEVLDHLIVGAEGFVSLRRRGTLYRCEECRREKSPCKSC